MFMDSELRAQVLANRFHYPLVSILRRRKTVRDIWKNPCTTALCRKTSRKCSLPGEMNLLQKPTPMRMRAQNTKRVPNPLKQLRAALPKKEPPWRGRICCWWSLATLETIRVKRFQRPWFHWGCPSTGAELICTSYELRTFIFDWRRFCIKAFFDTRQRYFLFGSNTYCLL